MVFISCESGGLGAKRIFTGGYRFLNITDGVEVRAGEASASLLNDVVICVFGYGFASMASRFCGPALIAPAASSIDGACRR
jgi:hypothetical protein